MVEPENRKDGYGNSPRAWQSCSKNCGRGAVNRICAAAVLLFGAMGVSGCVSVEQRQIRPGVYVISTPASEFINSEGRARVILNLRAQELCSKGFMRFREDRVIDTKGIEIVAWQVSCTT
jgi:hypothetical protein